MEAGLPLIQNFSPEDYGGVDQNFSLEIGKDGLLYVLNRSDLLVYDGVNWHKANIGSHRSMAMSEQNHIYIGGDNSIGVLLKDSVNRLFFHSLASQIPEQFRNFKVIEKIICTPDEVFFCGPHHLFQWIPQNDPTKGEMRAFSSEENFDPFHWVNGNLYVRKRGIGLTRFNGKEFELIPDGELFSGYGVRAIFPLNNQRETDFIIATTRYGLFYFDGEKITPYDLDPQTQKLLNNGVVFKGETLKNGDWVFQLIPQNIILTDSKGNLKHVFNQSMGLRNNQAWDVIEDNQDGLWIGLNDGLARISLHSPITKYDERIGMGRTINTITRLGNELYFGGQSGIYHLKKSTDIATPPEIELITSPLGQIGSLLTHSSDLIAGGGLGIARLNKNEVSSMIPLGVNLLYQSPYDPNMIYVGVDEGLRVFNVEEQTLSGVIQGIGQIVGSVVEEKPGVIWFSVYDKVIKLELNLSDLNNIEQNVELESHKTQIFGQENGIRSWSWVGNIDNKVLLGTPSGLRSFHEESQRFTLDSTYGSHFIDPGREIFKLFPIRPEEFMICSFIKGREQPILDLIKRNSEGIYTSEDLPYEKITDLGNIFSVYPDPLDPDIIWFGGVGGVIRYDTSVEEKMDSDFQVIIRGVVLADSITLYGGAYLDPDEKLKPVNMKYSESNIRFEYAAPVYEDSDKIEYQYILKGFEQKWSSWSGKAEKEYGNLPEGKYTFIVRARDRYNQISQEGSFILHISPPWYRSSWALLLYAIVFALLIYLFISWRIQKLKARNQELEALVEKRTQEIQEKNIQLADSLDHLQKTQQQLILQEKMASLGQVTMGIAHEVKNPLNFVNNYAQVSIELADELEEEFERFLPTIAEAERAVIKDIIKDLRENATVIRKNGQRADNIVSSMRNHANDNHGQRAEVSLNELIKEQVQLAYYGYKSQENYTPVHFEYNLTDDLSSIEVNPQEIGRVIINLVSNACYALNEKSNQGDDTFKPLIHIQTRQINQYQEIRIRDNGTGISQDNLAKIFQPFFTTKPTGQGNTGLGLSISYDIIVQGHQGKLTVDSVEGEYTEFVVVLPGKR
ncbi:MAG: ATP-binding protein [Bacteroidetes bacterium]|nr:ATP-binding protein [Bacteroidota bacterium]